MNAKIQFGLENGEYKALRNLVATRDGMTCQNCGYHSRSMKYFTMQYIAPVSDGGTNDPDNLRTVCLTCAEGIPAGYEPDRIYPFGYADRTRPDWHKYVYGGARKSENQG